MPERGFEALADHEERIGSLVKDRGSTPLKEVETKPVLEPVKIEGIDIESGMTLQEILNEVGEALTGMYGEEEILSWIDDLPEDIPILITEEVERRVAPESAEAAITTYKNWVIKQNNRFQHRLENKQIKNPPASLQSMMAARTLSKNEYIAWLNESMKEQPEELEKAALEIQMMSAMQLSIESRILEAMDQNQATLQSYLYAEINGIFADHLVEIDDPNGNSLKEMSYMLPKSYREMFETQFFQGVMAEVTALRMLDEITEELGGGDIDYEVVKTSKEADVKGGIDMILLATKGEETYGILIEVKKGIPPEIIRVENTPEGIKAMSGELEEVPERYNIPKSFLGAVSNPDAVTKFSKPIKWVRGISLRISNNLFGEGAEEDAIDDYKKGIRGAITI
jgi:hypothetical protein